MRSADPPPAASRRSSPAHLFTCSSSPFPAALLAWLFPGAGHYLLGQRPKAILCSVLILAAFIAGLAFGTGQNVFIGPERYAAIAQAPAGIPALASFAYARFAGISSIPTDLPRNFYDLGTLYTSVAGLLNALLVFDVVIRCYERRIGKRIER
ncbi:MAG: DUF6677 family protein [Planctomycetota bacterium]